MVSVSQWLPPDPDFVWTRLLPLKSKPAPVPLPLH
jgi:hypothetical protein